MSSRSLDYEVFDADNHMYETRQALTKFLLITGTAGNVRTTTLRAFNEAEFLKYIAAI